MECSGAASQNSGMLIEVKGRDPAAEYEYITPYREAVQRKRLPTEVYAFIE